MDILISGASTGIGRACAVHMARLGHTVWAGVRSQKSFDDVVKMNVKGLQPVFLDVTRRESIERALSEVKKKSGMLSALVNNAGIAVGGPVEGLTTEDWRRQFDVNFFGLVELTRTCLPLLRESKGRIVNISSIAGRVASPYLAPYAASKFALEAFSDSLRRELRPFGIQVSVVEPGSIQTPIWDKSIFDGNQRKADLSAEILAVYGNSLDRFFKYIDKVGRNGAPVSVVTAAVEHALSARSPRTRYPVGRGVPFMLGLSRVLPDRLIDRLLKA